MTPERVLVVDRAVIPAGAAWSGLRTEGVDAFLTTVAVHGRFEDRAAAEQDATRKQVIPYLVLRDAERYFLMRRTRAGADARLHDRYTIGVGGHLNPGDDGPLGGLEREWREELHADFLPAFRAIGLLNDESTDVGSVHIGIVYSADAAGRPVAVRERDKLSGAFADPVEVAAVVDGMESWSRLVFEALDRPEVP
ncbi:MAG: NUDIX domain-containing protein [Chloroflexota bacterium]